MTAAFAVALLAGCAPAHGPTAPAGPLQTTGQAPATGQESVTPVEPGKVELPWPADGAADAAALQAAADSGAQPWLLDPSEVAISYAAAAHGWTDAEAYPGPAGTSVDVRNGKGDRLTLTLAQPARTGPDGIWVVTAEQDA
ncbi:hypothetical protein BJF78_25855 [Pseudonocardia sp. CNS-139]|nr:hypothetical protein BJF78_25855 [Pseudonocardia sp. CNS-139]